MPMQWNDQADARLFANVLKLHVVKLDYPALAKAMGNGVTPKAISHRISKIKEKAHLYRRNNPYAFDPEPTPGSTSIGTTKGGKRTSKTGKIATARAGKKGGVSGSGDDDDDDEENRGVKPEIKMEGGWGFGGDDQGEEDERPLMELARERAFSAVLGGMGMGMGMGLGMGMEEERGPMGEIHQEFAGMQREETGYGMRREEEELALQQEQQIQAQVFAPLHVPIQGHGDYGFGVAEKQEEENHHHHAIMEQQQQQQQQQQDIMME